MPCTCPILSPSFFFLMPCVCPSCRARVAEHSDCISCDYCKKWYHLHCTDLTQAQFEIFSQVKSFEWHCNKCLSEKCNKCNLLQYGNKIQCEKCEKKYHLRCAGLSKTAYIPTSAWYCYQCQAEIFPFNSISVKQVSSLTFNSLNLNRHPNQIRSIHVSLQNNEPIFNPNCNICFKRVNQPNSAPMGIYMSTLWSVTSRFLERWCTSGQRSKCTDL